MPELQLSNEQAALIGLKIRETRLQLGIQQKDLVLGEFSKSYISLIESGRVLPSAKALGVIAPRLGLTTEQLLNIATPGTSYQVASETDVEVFSRWDLVLDEARINLTEQDPEQAKNVLLQKVKTRQLSSDQLKQYHLLLATAYAGTNDYEAALLELKTAGQMARNLGDDLGDALVNYETGKIYHQQSKYLLAVEIFRKTLDSLSNFPVEDLGFKQKLLSSLGDGYQALGDQNLAIQYYSEAVSQVETFQDLKQMADLSWKTSQAYREVNNLPMAKDYALKSLALVEAFNTLNNLVKSQSNLGSLLTQRQQYDQAREVLDKALSLAQHLGEKRLAAGAAINLTQLFSATSQTGEAIDTAKQSVIYAEQSGDIATIGQALARLAQSYFDSGDLDKSCEVFEKSLEFLKQAQVQDILAQTYFEYGQVLSSLGRTEQALRAMEKAYNLQVCGRSSRWDER